jgi:hypothetical protein
MGAAVTSLLRDKPPPFQQACFRCILQFQLISLLNRKPVSLYLCYFVLRICIHFVMLIKSGSLTLQEVEKHTSLSRHISREQRDFSSYSSTMSHIIDSEPSCHREAIGEQVWQDAITEEY